MFDPQNHRQIGFSDAISLVLVYPSEQQRIVFKNPVNDCYDFEIPFRLLNSTTGLNSLCATENQNYTESFKYYLTLIHS